MRAGQASKGGKDRTVLMHRRLVDELGPIQQESGAVVPGFPYRHREGQRPVTSYKGPFSKARAAAGIPANVSWHCLRHTFASYALMGGALLPVVSQWLGHSSVNVTMGHYACFAADFQRDMIDRLTFGPPAKQALKLSDAG